MKYFRMTGVAVGLLISTATFAQTQQSTGQSQSKQMSSPSQQMSTRSYKEIEDTLKKAGIQNVKTLNAAYLVSATTKSGENVTFVVDPPMADPSANASGSSAGSSSAATSGSASGSGGQQASLRGQQKVRDDLTKAGFSNVQILDAAYLAAGMTSSGDRITMMIDPSNAAGAATGSTSSDSGTSGSMGSNPSGSANPSSPASPAGAGGSASPGSAPKK